MKDFTKNMKPWMRIVVHAVAICFTGIILLWIGTLWLDVWTDHGHYKIVPNVKGIQYADACKRLTLEGFTVELLDSVYDSSAPGTVVEQSPKMGTKVKDGRLVYLTVNAFSPKTVTLPNIIDTSLRQAQSVLNGLGVKNIEIKYVPSEYKDLVLSVSRGGQRISAGARIPVSSRILLEVGTGSSEEPTDGEEPTVDVEHLNLF